jgi:hypothetical protein
MTTEHRATTTRPSDPDRQAATPSGSVIGPLDPQSAAHLTTSRGFPCISVLMPTIPGSRMTTSDATRLAGLLDDAERQLEEHGVMQSARLLAALGHLARSAQHSRADHGLGLFVNLSMARGWTLPTTVRTKVVVESTFATRDLLRALHRTPPHMVVRLDPFGARVFWVSGVATPIGTVERVTAGSGHSSAGSDPATASEERRDFLGKVDTLLGRLRRERPAPLVLAGDPALLADLKARGRWLHRLAGEVHDPEAASPALLFPAAASRLQDYLYQRGQQTLDALAQASYEAPDRLVGGLDDCWAAVTAHTPGTLVVEHSYVHPGPSAGPGGRTSHDLVDDLLELALERGNLIAFVDDDQLHEFGGIALLKAR